MEILFGPGHSDQNNIFACGLDEYHENNTVGIITINLVHGLGEYLKNNTIGAISTEMVVGIKLFYATLPYIRHLCWLLVRWKYKN